MKLDKQTVFLVIAFVASVVTPILVAEGYTGEVPAELVPIAVGLSSFIAWAIKKYQERNPQKAHFKRHTSTS